MRQSAAIAVVGVVLFGIASAPPAPKVVLIAGEDGDEDDSEITASALAHLLADRHGMKTTQVRAHSAEIGRALDALSDADLALLFVRFRTWPEAEQRRLEAFRARGGGVIELRTPEHPSDFSQEPFRRQLVQRIRSALRLPELPDLVDTALPVDTPIVAFEVSTAYVSDWTKPIASQVFPPEEGIGGFNDVQWIALPSPDGALDLRRFDPNSKQGTIYVKSQLTVKGARELELVLQSDDGLEVFVDGKKRASRQEIRSLHSGCDLVPLSLEDGAHELMLKVVNAGGAWAVRTRVRDLTAYRAEKPK